MISLLLDLSSSLFFQFYLHVVSASQSLHRQTLYSYENVHSHNVPMQLVSLSSFKQSLVLN